MLLLSKRDLQKPTTPQCSLLGNQWEDPFHYLQMRGGPGYSSKCGTRHPIHGSWRGYYPGPSSLRRCIPGELQPDFSSTTQHRSRGFLLYVLLKLPKVFTSFPLKSLCHSLREAKTLQGPLEVVVAFRLHLSRKLSPL